MPDSSEEVDMDVDLDLDVDADDQFEEANVEPSSGPAGKRE
jgi:hypothetical protein